MFAPLRIAAPCLVVVAVGLGGCPKPPARTPQPLPPTSPGSPTTARAPSQAAEPKPTPLPTAAEVLDAAVQALGGHAALEGVRSYYSRATIEVKGQNLVTTVEIWWEADNFHMRSDMRGFGVSQVWKQGNEVWADDPLHGVRSLDAKQATQAAIDASLSLPAYWRRYFDEAQTTAVRVADGSELIDVQFAADDGTALTMSFDRATGLPYSHAAIRDTPLGTIPVTTSFEDYRDVAGIQIPFSSTITLPIYESTLKIEQFDVDVDIEPDTFTP